MVNLLLVLVVYCGSLYADFDSDGKIKTAVVSRGRVANFDEYDEEKLAKRMKKFGARASAGSSISTGGKRPISTISRIFDKSKLGPVPSTYSDKKRKLEIEKIQAFVMEISCDYSKVRYENLKWSSRATIRN